jgi:hypothetical protein
VYIRWIKRGHKNEYAAHVTFHDAYLAESYRDQSEHPRQRTLAYLGHIRQIDGQFSAIEREIFLLRAQEMMEKVLKLSPVEIDEMLAQLHRHVPPANYAEALRAFRENLRWFYQWCKNNQVAFPTRELQTYLQEAEKAAKAP